MIAGRVVAGQTVKYPPYSHHEACFASTATAKEAELLEVMLLLSVGEHR